jgi:DNA-binding response OmpR family regulator
MSGKSPTILIVEDEADVKDYLETVLVTNGYGVRSSATVEEADQEVAENPPDLILLDIMMPRETGMSFYIRLRKNKKHADIPVMIISGAVQEKEFNFRSYVPDKSIPPPDKYMEKPIIVDKFLENVNKLVSKAATGRC